MINLDLITVYILLALDGKTVNHKTNPACIKFDARGIGIVVVFPRGQH